MQNLNAIPLSALRAIEAIARTGTMAQAAEELGVTAGALSQRLSKAEAALGHALFIRAPSGLKPTKLCAEVTPRLTRAMGDLSSVVADMRSTQSTSLTVSVAPIFASRWLIWRIRRFHEEHPSVGIQLVPKADIVDLDHSEVDVGIRVGQDPALGIGAVKLLDQRVFPVCSPEVADRIKSPDDLKTIPVIRENEALYGWTPWLASHGLTPQDLKVGPTYADASLCLDAAMTGQGMYMAWETLACDALERGQIAAPFGHRAMTGATYWFAARRHSAKSQSIKAFQSWLQGELARSVAQWRAEGDQTAPRDC